MKHVYLFNETSRAAVYGIGTYIRQLTECLEHIPDLTVSLVELRSSKKEFTVKQTPSGTPVYHFPDPARKHRKEYNKYYRNIFYILAQYIRVPEGEELFFHLNYMQQSSLVAPMKARYPQGRIFYTIHYQDWCFTLKGNQSNFQRILRNYREQNTENRNLENTGESAENGMEKAVINSYIEEKKFFDQIDGIVCLAHFTRKMLQTEYNVPEQKIRLIYNGLKDNTVTSLSRESLKRQYNIPVQDKILLFVGRLDPIKGIEYIIQAFKLLFKKDPDWRLMLVGDGNYSPYLKECKPYWSRITFTGRVDQEDLYTFYRMADVGVMASTHEQCSYVAIEMMRSGLPMVVTTSTGLSEMLHGSNRDYKVPVKELENGISISPVVLRNKILKALADPEYPVRIRRNYEQYYIFEGMRKNYESLYTK